MRRSVRGRSVPLVSAAPAPPVLTRTAAPTPARARSELAAGRQRPGGARPSSTAPATDGAEATDGVDAPKLDGRRTHIVDRALDYALLAEQGLSASRIARKRRRSAGYVSIVLRLGRAIQGMEPAELAALRSPRITWKLAQRIVRQDTDVVSVRHQLRSAVGGFSTHNVDGRKHRKRRGDGSMQPRTVPRTVGVAWGWDAAWFARDPVEYVGAHLRYLAGVHQSVRTRAGQTVAAHGLERLSVGQSIRALQRSLVAARSDTEPGSPIERDALSALEILTRHLTAAGTEITALLGAAAGAAPIRSPRAAGGTGPAGASGTSSGTSVGASGTRTSDHDPRAEASESPDELDSALDDDLRD